MKQIKPKKFPLLGRLSHPKPIVQVILTGLWILFFLAVIDGTVNWLFPYPTDPLAFPSNSLQVYFEYGRSIEGKLSRILGNSDETSAPIAQTGWLNLQEWQKSEPTQLQPGDDLMLTFYGMSFSGHIAEAIKTLDPRLTVRAIGGPSA